MKADKVYLVGFMGAGKSSVGRALGRRLGWQFVDIDDLIEKREHASVSSVFARRGEAYFRAIERTVLGEQLARRNLVVATGGGTFVDPQNRALIHNDGASIWLDVPLDRLIARVPADGRRPLAADRAGFERLYAARRPSYAEAQQRIDAGRAGIEAIVDEIVDWLES